MNDGGWSRAHAVPGPLGQSASADTKRFINEGLHQERMDRTNDDDALRALLHKPRRIAVLGASPNSDRASHRIFRHLKGRGHDVLPVNPVAPEVDGTPTVPDLKAAVAHWGAPPDIVDVFRSPEHLPPIVEEAIESGTTWLWLQLGVVHDQAIQRALEAELEVVVDRCMLVEDQRLA